MLGRLFHLARDKYLDMMNLCNADGHLKQSANIPLGELTDPGSMANLDDNQNIYVHCAGGYRSVIAASLIKREGIHNLRNVVGGWGAIKQLPDKFEIEKKREKEYLKKYEEIKEYLVSKLGKPTSTEEDKSSTNYFYRLIWKEKDIVVLVLLKFSTELTYLPGDMIVGSFNIRVKVNYNQ